MTTFDYEDNKVYIKRTATISNNPFMAPYNMWSRLIVGEQHSSCIMWNSIHAFIVLQKIHYLQGHCKNDIYDS